MPREPFGLRQLLREFILPPFAPGAGVCRPLTLIDLVKVLFTLASGAVGYWALYGLGVLWGLVAAVGAAWLWRPLLLAGGLGVVLVVNMGARACRTVLGRTDRSM
jgi:hypothetical protein